MTPARRHRERTLAALQGAANPQFDQARANAYELQLMQLAEHRRTLKGIQSIERKIDVKRTMLPVYKPWIDGLLAADRGGQDERLHGFRFYRGLVKLFVHGFVKLCVQLGVIN